MKGIIKERVWKESKTHRIWGVLQRSKNDITMTLISQKAKVSREKTYEVINWMLKNKLIVVTRKVGSSRFFKKK